MYNVIIKKSGDELEYPSLEFIEDSYLPKLDSIVTPSLDDVHGWPQFSKHHDLDNLHYDLQTNDYFFDWAADEADLYLRSLTLDQILDIHKVGIETSISTVSLDQMQAAKAEFTQFKLASSDKLKTKLFKLFKKKSLRDVRVTFIDFSKPYSANVSSGDNFKHFLHIGHLPDGATEANITSPTDSVGSIGDVIDELAGLTLEEQQKQRAEWSTELARVEEEITTLRTVLQSKVRHASELKRKLGITVWREMSDDVSQSLKTVKESNVITYGFQKTESAVKTAAEKTSSLFSGITGGFTSKISQMKNSESFKSFEERVGSAYENVKTKVSTSRSGSIASFNDIQDGSIPTTPTIPEKSEKFMEN